MTIDYRAAIEHQARAAGIRMDANEGAFFARQLESVAAQTFDIRYPELMGIKLVPRIGGIDPGADFYTYRTYDRSGTATLIRDYSTDLPRVDVHGTEAITAIHGYGNSYGYTVQDVRRLAMSPQASLDAKRAFAARDIIARKVDMVLAFGDDTVGTKGFTNNPNVPVVTPTTGDWATATAAEILADLYKLERSIVTATNGVESADTIALPNGLYTLIATRPSSDLTPLVTILEVFLKNSRTIKTAEAWYQLETADADGTGPRIVAYRRDPMKLGAVLPIEFEQHAPQFKNLAWLINCDARCGGTVFYYPKSAAYMDGC